MKYFLSPVKWIELILLGVLVASIIALVGDNGITRLYELRRQRDEIRSEIQALKEQNRELERQVELLQNGHRYLERIAREELGLVGPNETVFRFSQGP